MSNIIILTDKFEPSPLANGLCVRNLAESLAQNGQIIHLIAFNDPFVKKNYHYNNINVHYLETDLRLKLFYLSLARKTSFSKLLFFFANFYSKLIRLIFIFFYPISNFTFSNRIFRKMEDIHKYNKIDLIISTFSPFENLISSNIFKNKYKSIPWFIYFLDDFNFSLQKNILTHLFKNRLSNLENMFFNNSDKQLILSTNLHKINSSIKDKFHNKFLVTDIPLFVNNSFNNSSFSLDKYFIKGSYNWVYAGSLNKRDYNPDFLISIFKSLINFDKNKQRYLHIFARGELFDYVKKLSKISNGRIVCHGYLNHDELIKILLQSDLLISIKNSDAISAKIFEYISLNKKILHFSGHKFDPNVKFLEKYTNSLICNSKLGISDYTLQKIVDFEDKLFLPFDLNNFITNSPNFTSNLILNSLQQFYEKV